MFQDGFFISLHSVTARIAGRETVIWSLPLYLFAPWYVVTSFDIVWFWTSYSNTPAIPQQPTFSTVKVCPNVQKYSPSFGLFGKRIQYNEVINATKRVRFHDIFHRTLQRYFQLIGQPSCVPNSMEITANFKASLLFIDTATFKICEHQRHLIKDATKTRCCCFTKAEVKNLNMHGFLRIRFKRQKDWWESTSVGRQNHGSRRYRNKSMGSCICAYIGFFSTETF